MSLGLGESIGAALMVVFAVLAAALGVMIKLFGRQKEKLRETQAQMDAVAEHMARQKAMQERINKAAAKNQQRERDAVQRAREGHRDHFENQP